VTETLPRNTIIGKLTAHIPPAQFSRYLLIGIGNTVFGYATYAAFTALLTPHIPHAYIVASLLGGGLNITEAFLAYKWFVFKTHGNYLREWLRCVVVYSGGIFIGILLLPLFVFALRHLTQFDSSAPYIAGAVLTGLNVITGFLGHKNFSFADVGRD
jgi:putative flippase GtrA